MEHTNTRYYYRDYALNMFTAKIYDYKLCGIHNKINLYPKDSNIDIIYVNKAVDSESEFSILFQVMDYRLINSDKTNFRFMIDENINSQQSLSIGQMLAIEILYLRINKLSIIILHLPSNSLYYIYDGPVIGTDFKVKTFRRSIKLSSFQCTILSKTNITNYIKYGTIDRGISRSLTVGEGDRISVQLPINQCQYRYGQHCMFKVSFQIFFIVQTAINSTRDPKIPRGY